MKKRWTAIITSKNQYKINNFTVDKDTYEAIMNTLDEYDKEITRLNNKLARTETQLEERTQSYQKALERWQDDLDKKNEDISIIQKMYTDSCTLRKTQLKTATNMRMAAEIKCEILQDQLRVAIEEAPQRVKDLEAQCAAMREALDKILWWLEQEGEYAELRNEVRQVLAPDAGAALLERLAKAESKVQHMRKCTDEILEISDLVETELAAKLAKAEAERVEAVNLKEVESMAKAVHEAYCKIFRRQNGAEYWTKGDYDKLDELAKEYDRVTVRAVLAYLRDNNHIREAE